MPKAGEIRLLRYRCEKLMSPADFSCGAVSAPALAMCLSSQKSAFDPRGTGKRRRISRRGGCACRHRITLVLASIVTGLIFNDYLLLTAFLTLESEHLAP